MDLIDEYDALGEVIAHVLEQQPYRIKKNGSYYFQFRSKWYWNNGCLKNENKCPKRFIEDFFSDIKVLRDNDYIL